MTETIQDFLDPQSATMLQLILESEMSGVFSQERIVDFLELLRTEGRPELASLFIGVIEAMIVDARRAHRATVSDGPFD